MDSDVAALAAVGVTGKPRNMALGVGGKVKAARMTEEQLGASYTAHQSAAGACASSAPQRRHDPRLPACSMPPLSHAHTRHTPAPHAHSLFQAWLQVELEPRPRLAPTTTSHAGAWQQRGASWSPWRSA